MREDAHSTNIVDRLAIALSVLTREQYEQYKSLDLTVSDAVLKDSMPCTKTPDVTHVESTLNWVIDNLVSAHPEEHIFFPAGGSICVNQLFNKHLKYLDSHAVSKLSWRNGDNTSLTSIITGVHRAATNAKVHAEVLSDQSLVNKDERRWAFLPQLREAQAALNEAQALVITAIAAAESKRDCIKRAMETAEQQG